MRMLDNVIDINYYAVKKARDSNLRHRPVGLGIMGFQDALYETRVPYASEAAVEFADRSMEAVCYHAYWASTELAAERGRYSSYRGSLWDTRHPADRLARPARRAARQPEDGRGKPLVEIDRARTLDWDALRARIAEHGMRNSNCVAIAPTATISNIIGVSASIEPCVRQPVGEVEPVGRVHDRQRVPGARPEDGLGLWDEVMVMDLKHFDGSLQRDRPRARGPEGALRDRVRGRDAVAGRGRGAAPEVDRPGAVAQHLHGRRLGQEARRDLQARLAARPEDDLLPAHAERDHAEKSTVQIEPAQRRLERRAQRRVRRCASSGRGDAAQTTASGELATATSSSARSTTPSAKRVSE